MMRTCYYKILGVAVRASQEDIKKAFRLLALRWHPDRNPGEPQAGERFKEALKAYETLIDPSSRREYDDSRGYRERGKNGGRRSKKKRVDVGASVEGVLRDAFGIGERREPRREGGEYDLRFEVQAARSAVNGGYYEQISYERLVFCSACVGSPGVADGVACSRCEGRGEVLEISSAEVWIPDGCEQGARLRICGGGDLLRPGSRPGDLVVLVHILEGR